MGFNRHPLGSSLCFPYFLSSLSSKFQKLSTPLPFAARAFNSTSFIMPRVQRTMHDIYPFISPGAALKDSAKGKTVLVTGGGKGIGRAVAVQFALAGASTIIISGRSASPLDETKSIVEAAAPGCAVLPISADVIDKTSVQQLFDRLPRTPDVLVNNAGVSMSQSSIVDSKIDLWWSDWETNVKGLYLFTRSYLRGLAGKPGVILNVSSSVSDTVSPNLSSYATSKTAVNRLTEFIHAEHAKEGVCCIAFHPGGIAETGMGQTAPEQFRSRLYDSVNLAAGTAVYLSTPRASFLAGRFVFSNWDMKQLEELKDRIVSEDLLKSRIRLGEQLDSAVVPPGEAGSA